MQRQRRNPWVALGIFLLAWTLTTGCDNTRGPAAERRRLVHVTVVGPGRDDPDFAVIAEAARGFGQRQPDVTVDVQVSKISSPAQQRLALAALLTAKTDAVCVMPIEPDAILPEIAQLSRAGRLVVTFGRDAGGSVRVAYVGPHEEDIGFAAADAALAYLSERATSVALVGPGAQDERYGTRYRAIKSRLASSGKAEIIREVDCTSQPWAAADQVREESRRYPRVACWVLLDDWPIRSAKDSPRLAPDTSAIVVCSASPRYFSMLRWGEINALMVYDLPNTVNGAISTAVNAVRQSPMGVQDRDIAVEVLTAKNLEAFEKRRDAWKRAG